MKAFLILEDGTVFSGTSIGSKKDIISEIVFNTSMTGYLEELTDPSYAGQAVVMTYPLIGNYGITPDSESRRAWPDGYIVRELSRIPSNFRCESDIQSFLKEHDITGISGIDTRALTKLIRDKGSMNGMITTNASYSEEEVIEKIKAYKATGLVEKVTCKEKSVVKGDGPKVALMDFGVKDSIAKKLNEMGCNVTIYPAFTKADEVLADAPDGIFLSNGPGNPADCDKIADEIKKMVEANIPMFAAGLGHQLLAIANGGKTYKLSKGHRGGHPVKNTTTGKVVATSQCNSYAVDAKSLAPEVAEETFVSVTDGSNEGLGYKGRKVISVQFNPEGCPGPKEMEYLLKDFVEMMKGAE